MTGALKKMDLCMLSICKGKKGKGGYNGKGGEKKYLPLPLLVNGVVRGVNKDSLTNIEWSSTNIKRKIRRLC